MMSRTSSASEARNIHDQHHRVRMSRGDRVFHIVNYTVFSLITLACLFPFYYLFINTISDNELVRLGYMKRNTNRRQQRSLPQSRPYRYLSDDGTEILVGKNALQNDRLTMEAPGDAIWLHAKDMPGSHVIIRAAGEVSPRTLNQAAQLAAWYSRGQRSSMVPIDYTLRKYVKKPSGA